jgi:hypothetical protein
MCARLGVSLVTRSIVGHVLPRTHVLCTGEHAGGKNRRYFEEYL